MKQFLKHYWEQQSEREQMFLAIGSLCLLLYLFYALVYSPLLLAVHRAQADYWDKKNTLLWMQQASHLYAHEQMPKKVTTTTNLLSVLTNLLSQAPLQRFPYQLAQTSGADIQLTFAEVPYTLFISWLHTQSREYALVIKNLYFTKTDSPGIVKARVVLGVDG